MASFTVRGRDGDEAAKLWNTRTPPPGYALVPIEPTIGMVVAMEKEFNGEFHPDFYPVSIWKAAIKAMVEEHNES